VSAPDAPRLASFYAGRRVMVTGHTGFKGGWLTLWLAHMGAHVTGVALPPDTEPSFFRAIDLASMCRHVVGDVRNLTRLRDLVATAQPDVIFHLAAQALVRRSYAEPIVTLETNVIGTANLLEAVRTVGRPCAVVVVTSDKCYENREREAPYVEADAMGGHDVYSMSKGAAELVTSSWRRSFFHPDRLASHGVAIASARAGNVIGGGDWANDRLVPDAIRALTAGRAIGVRNPESVRPWQHVLEPLGGYLTLGMRLREGGTAARAATCDAWNFGPAEVDSVPVRDLVDTVVATWGEGAAWVAERDPNAPHEAGLLRLDIDKARTQLGWTPRWHVEEACRRTVDWYHAHHRGATMHVLRALSLHQLDAYLDAEVLT